MRTVQYYDQLGLLKPSAHSESGRRLYREQDFIVLQQIIALRFLGLALTDIRDLLTTDFARFRQVLHQQKQSLRARMSQLQQIISVIESAESAMDASSGLDAKHVLAILKELSSAMKTDWLDQFLTGEQQRHMMREQGWTELKAEGTAWQQLFRDIQAYDRDHPDEAALQSLLNRWHDLMQAATGGDSQMQASIEAAYLNLATLPGLDEYPDDIRVWLRDMQSAVQFVRASSEAGG